MLGWNHLKEQQIMIIILVIICVCTKRESLLSREISGSHGGEYEVQSLLAYTAV
jgi:hypothetical protein